MFVLKSPIIKDINISSLHPNRNYSDYDFLFAYNGYSYTLNKIIFSTSPDLDDIFKNCEIEKIELCFKVNLFWGTNIKFFILKNLSSYELNKVTWRNCPMSSSEINIPWNYDKDNNLLKLDLTTALPFLFPTDSDNLGFQLICRGSFMNLLFSSSRVDTSPYIELKVNKLPFPVCQTIPGYIGSNIKNEDQSIIEVKNIYPIPFNNVAYNKYINLSPDSNEFIITKPGIYFIIWQVYLYATSKVNKVSISTMHDEELLSSNYFPSSENQIMGQTIIEVNQNQALHGYNICLRNTCCELSEDKDLGTIFLAPLLKPASIIIFSICK